MLFKVLMAVFMEKHTRRAAPTPASPPRRAPMTPPPAPAPAPRARVPRRRDLGDPMRRRVEHVLVGGPPKSCVAHPSRTAARCSTAPGRYAVLVSAMSASSSPDSIEWGAARLLPDECIGVGTPRAWRSQTRVGVTPDRSGSSRSPFQPDYHEGWFTIAAPVLGRPRGRANSRIRVGVQNRYSEETAMAGHESPAASGARRSARGLRSRSAP